MTRNDASGEASDAEKQQLADTITLLEENLALRRELSQYHQAVIANQQAQLAAYARRDAVSSPSEPEDSKAERIS